MVQLTLTEKELHRQLDEESSTFGEVFREHDPKETNEVRKRLLFDGLTDKMEKHRKVDNGHIVGFYAHILDKFGAHPKPQDDIMTFVEYTLLLDRCKKSYYKALAANKLPSLQSLPVAIKPATNGCKDEILCRDEPLPWKSHEITSNYENGTAYSTDRHDVQKTDTPVDDGLLALNGSNIVQGLSSRYDRQGSADSTGGGSSARSTTHQTTYSRYSGEQQRNGGVINISRQEEEFESFSTSVNRFDNGNGGSPARYGWRVDASNTLDIGQSPNSFHAGNGHLESDIGQMSVNELRHEDPVLPIPSDGDDDAFNNRMSPEPKENGVSNGRHEDFPPPRFDTDGPSMRNGHSAHEDERRESWSQPDSRMSRDSGDHHYPATNGHDNYSPTKEVPNGGMGLNGITNGNGHNGHHADSDLDEYEARNGDGLSGEADFSAYGMNNRDNEVGAVHHLQHFDPSDDVLMH